jgi:hypothetical protein
MTYSVISEGICDAMSCIDSDNLLRELCREVADKARCGIWTAKRRVQEEGTATETHDHIRTYDGNSVGSGDRGVSSSPPSSGTMPPVSNVA